MDVPTTSLVNGIIQTIRMIKGIDLNTLTTAETSRFSGRFPRIWPSRVRKSTTPAGQADHETEKPRDERHHDGFPKSVSNMCSIGSDITQYLGFYVVSNIEVDGFLGIFGCAGDLDEHKSEIRATGLVEVCGDDVEIDLQAVATRSIGGGRPADPAVNSRRTSGWPGVFGLGCASYPGISSAGWSFAGWFLAGLCSAGLWPCRGLRIGGRFLP